MERYQKMPVRTTVMMSSGAKTPMPILITQRSVLFTGLTLASCLAVTSQAIQAATRLKPISEIGMPTLLVRKSRRSKTFLPKILKSARDPKLNVQKSPMRAAATVIIQVIIERLSVPLEVRTAATTASNIEIELVIAATTKQK